MSDDFEYEMDIRVRFRDSDLMGHVNNAVYSTYLEEARTGYLQEVAGVDPAEIDSVLASLDLEFREPVEPGETISVAATAADLGTSSITMAYEVRRENGAVAAVGETVQVAYDREAETSKPLPDAWREAIEGTRA